MLKFTWVLNRKGLSRADISQTTTSLLESPGFIVGKRAAVTRALKWFRQGQADFADYFIHFDGIEQEAEELGTFDAVFAKEHSARKSPHCMAVTPHG